MGVDRHRQSHLLGDDDCTRYSLGSTCRSIGGLHTNAGSNSVRDVMCPLIVAFKSLGSMAPSHNRLVRWFGSTAHPALAARQLNRANNSITLFMIGEP
jgi:hypothetical protein